MSLRNIGRRGSGGGTVSQAQIDAAIVSNPEIVTETELNAEKARIDALTASQGNQGTNIAATTTDIADLNAAQGVQDGLIALNATKAEVALIQADNDAQDPFLTIGPRNPDDSIPWTKESGASGTITAPTPIPIQVGTLSELNAGLETTPKSYSPAIISNYIDGRKVHNYSSYGEANAQGAKPRDTIFIIGMQKEAWARSETTGNFPFPGTGEPDAHWFKVGSLNIVYHGNAGVPQLNHQNAYFADDTVGAFPAAETGAWFDVLTYQTSRTEFDENNLPPFTVERYIAVSDPATPANLHWVSEGITKESGNTIYRTYFTERLEAFWFDFHDRRATWEATRRTRFSLTVDELTTGNADFTLVAGDYAGITAQAGYTRLVGRLELTPGGAGYDVVLDWRRVNGEYQVVIQDNHNGAAGNVNGWGSNRYGAVDNVIAKSSATDPAKPTWEATTAYPTDSVVIAKAPAGVTETQDNWYIGEAQSDRPNTVATLDAAEWVEWTWEALVPSKQDIVVQTLADRPDPATLLSGSRVSVVADPVPSNNVSYTVVGPVDGAGTGYSDFNIEDPQSLLLDYILVNVRSSGTNASSSVSITFTDNDGNDYPHADWVYSADLLQYAGGTATIVTDKAAWSGTLGIGHNKQGPVKFYYIGDNPNGLSAVAGAGANGGETQDVSVEYQGTNYSDTFDSTGDVSGPLYWTTSQEIDASDQAAPLINAIEYVSGSVFSNPEPDNTDPDYGTWFNWRVNDGETIADTDVPNGTEAEFLAIKGKLTRFGVGSKPAISLGYLAPVDRVVSSPDPIPTAGAPFERVLYQGVTTDDIYVMDNAGDNPISVTNPGSSDWPNGVRVIDAATDTVYSYDRGTNKFEALPTKSETIATYSITASDVIFTPTTFNLDYTTFEERLLDTEVYSPGHDITFGIPTFPTGANDRPIRHRVFINANTTDINVDFTAAGWKKLGAADDAETITVPAGENRTLEFTHSESSGFGYVRVLGSSGDAVSVPFVPHIFEVSGTGAGASGGSPYMFRSFVAEQDGFYLPEPTEYDIYRNQSGTNRVSAHIQLNSSTTGGGISSNPNELWRQYMQKANVASGSTTDIAVTNDNGGPYIASVPVQLVAGATYYLYHISNTGQFRNTNTARVKFTKINTDPQLELPTEFHVTNTPGNQNGNGLVSNGVYRSNNSGPLNGSGFGNYTWRVKVTVIGDWISQHYFNDTGNNAFRDSFDGGASWSSWGS